MTAPAVGASVVTRRQLVDQLLNRGQQVRAIVRSLEALPKVLEEHGNLSLVEASVLDLSDIDFLRNF